MIPNPSVRTYSTPCAISGIANGRTPCGKKWSYRFLYLFDTNAKNTMGAVGNTFVFTWRKSSFWLDHGVVFSPGSEPQGRIRAGRGATLRVTGQFYHGHTYSGCYVHGSRVVPYIEGRMSQ